MAGEPLITVVGNLVADPEPRVSQAGKSWCTFRIASTPRVRDRQSGEYTDGEPLWLGCRAYGQYADNIVASLQKGARVVIQGRLTQRSYTDNQGQQRTSLDLEVEEIGPSLRFATAQVARTSDRGQVGGWGQQGQAQGQGAWGQPAAQQSQGDPGNPWGSQPQQGPPPGQQNAPQGQPPAQGNPWNNGEAFSGGFDDEQPF